MKLPNLERLTISELKITGYLLSEKHPVGRTKANLFKQFGYILEQWELLAKDLQAIALSTDVSKIEQSPFGVRYVVDGTLSTPSGRELPIRTIWFVDNDEQIPHFITAYPR